MTVYHAANLDHLHVLAGAIAANRQTVLVGLPCICEQGAHRGHPCHGVYRQRYAVFIGGKRRGTSWGSRAEAERYLTAASAFGAAREAAGA